MTPGTFKSGAQWARAYAQGREIDCAFKGGAEFYAAAQVPLTNLLSNGGFEADTSGWTGSLTLSRQALSPSHGEVGSWYARNTGTVNGAHYLQRSAALTVVNGRRYYLRCRAATATAQYGYTIQFYNTATALAQGVVSANLTTAWSLYDAIWTANTTSLTLRVNYSGGNGNQTRTGWLDNVMIIDLTAAYGAGSEPDLATIRQRVLNRGGYWDGTLS